MFVLDEFNLAAGALLGTENVLLEARNPHRDTALDTKVRRIRTRNAAGSRGGRGVEMGSGTVHFRLFEFHLSSFLVQFELFETVFQAFFDFFELFLVESQFFHVVLQV